MTSLPSAHVFQCLFTNTLIGRNLTAQSMGSNRGIGGGIQIAETQLQALLPFPAPPPSALESLLAAWLNLVQQAYFTQWLATHDSPGYWFCFAFTAYGTSHIGVIALTKILARTITKDPRDDILINTVSIQLSIKLTNYLYMNMPVDILSCAC